MPKTGIPFLGCKIEINRDSPFSGLDVKNIYITDAAYQLVQGSASQLYLLVLIPIN